MSLSQHNLRLLLPAIVFLVLMIRPIVTSAETVSTQALIAVSALSERFSSELSQIRAVVPLRSGGFLAAGTQETPSRTRPMVVLIDFDGNLSDPIAVTMPKNMALSGGRLDDILEVDQGYIGIGHVVESKGKSHGWVVRLDHRFRTQKSIVLPSVTPHHTLAYYYSGKINRNGRLIVAGRSGAPDYVGMGYEHQRLGNGQLRLESVYNPGPAWRSGLRANDVITHVDNQALSGMSRQNSIELLTGALGATAKLTINRDGKLLGNYVVPREKIRGPVTGVVVALNPHSLEISGAPMAISAAGYRSGIQDIAMGSDNHIIATGWNESPYENEVFDQMWVVRLDDALKPLSNTTFGDGAKGTFIGLRVLNRPDSGHLILGTGASTYGVAVEADTNEKKVIDGLSLIDDWNPGGSTTFRVGAMTADNGVIVGGTYKDRKNTSPQAFVYALHGQKAEQPPRPIFENCEKSYVWDAAVSAQGPAIYVGRCVNANSEQLAAIAFTSIQLESNQPVLSESGTPIELNPWVAADNDIQTSTFVLSEPQSIRVFAVGGAEGLLTLIDSNSQVLDYTLVGVHAPGLIDFNLEPGQYTLKWESTKPVRIGSIQVTRVEAVRSSSGRDLALDEQTILAMQILGYESALFFDSGSLSKYATSDLRRDIRALQLSKHLVVTGVADQETVLHLIVDAAEVADLKAAEMAAKSREYATTVGTKEVAHKTGMVSGRWVGSRFLGVGRISSRTYSGQWNRGSDGYLSPNGYGQLESNRSNEQFSGQFLNGKPNGLGVQIAHSFERLVGEFNSIFTGYGAIYSASQELIQAGLFSGVDQDLVKAISLY